MKTVLLGAGNLATHLGNALKEAGHEVLQVYSRTMESATTLAEKLEAVPINDLNMLTTDGDLYILSVKDSVLPSLIPLVCQNRPDKLFVHTAGSMPISLFEPYATHYGVFYPMQTFTKNRKVVFNEIPCFIEASDLHARSVLETLAHTLTGQVFYLEGEKRRQLHLAAVFACNFTNHCYSLAEQILASEGLSLSVMLPLIDETARKVHELSPREAQTGPAVRYDQNVMDKQAALLADAPLAERIYRLMSESIHSLCTNEAPRHGEKEKSSAPTHHSSHTP